jgi:hypothetical protein
LSGYTYSVAERVLIVNSRKKRNRLLMFKGLYRIYMIIARL